MIFDTVPARVVNLHRVRALPLVGLLFAAVMGALVLAFALALGARTQRRDLAILRALGLTSGGAARVLTWQGVTLAAVMLLVGLPLGALAGSLLWRELTRQLGIGSGSIVAGGLIALVPATVAVAVLASLLPARQLRKDRVGVLLRTE
jgi:putative ABC transport system permease protein